MKNVQVSVLANLRPETVAALEGISFRTQVLALPGVQSVDFSLSDVDGIGKLEGEEIDVEAAINYAPETERRLVVMDKHILAGGLDYDRDSSSSNPMDGDGEGSIYHAGRRAKDSAERAQYYAALGMTADGDRDLNDEEVLKELAAHVVKEMRKDRSLMATLSSLFRHHGESGKWDAVCDKIAKLIQVEGWENVMDVITAQYLGGGWWQRVDGEQREKLEALDFMLRESDAEAAWDRVYAKGALGDPLAVLLDIYEHGGVTYSVSGSGMQCRWDTSRGAAVWVPDACAKDNIRHTVLKGLGIGEVKWFGACGSKEDPLHARYSLDGGSTWTGNYASWEQAMNAMVAASDRKIDSDELQQLMAAEAVKYCKSTLESYNDWVNGNVYGVKLYVIDRETGECIDELTEECWGYIGHSYAEETLESSIVNMVVKLGAPMH